MAAVRNSAMASRGASGFTSRAACRADAEAASPKVAPAAPVTAGAAQARRAGKTDGTATVLSADSTRLVLSSHLGGRGQENFRAVAMCPDGGFVIVGETSSADWPVLNALQPRSRGGGNDAVVMKFVPVGAK